MRRRSVLAATLGIMSVAACSDTIAPTRTARTALSPTSDSDLDRSGGRGVFNRYVAIGTSVSMGWQSDGVVAATQETSWPEQLAELAHRSITQPTSMAPAADPLWSHRWDRGVGSAGKVPVRTPRR